MNYFITRKFGDKEYRVNLPLFYLTIILLISLVCFGFSLNDWSMDSKFYVSCSDVNGCINPYYNSINCLDSVYSSTPLCTQEKLFFNQSIGEEPNFIIRNLNVLVVTIIGLFILFNSIFFNRELVKGLKLA